MEVKKQKLLSILKQERGIITTACEKFGISRRTFYLWKDNDGEFKEKAEEMVKEEKVKLNAYVQQKLLDLIDQNHIAAIIFWLKCNHPNFQLQHRLKIEGKLEEVRELSPKDKDILKKAIKYGTTGITTENPDRPQLQEKSGNQ